jgi:ankyrin repeat protein
MADTPKEEVKESIGEKVDPVVSTIDASKFVSLDNLDDIKKTLEDGTIKDINITDDKGNTVLHTNSAKGNLAIIKYLLEHAPPSDVNKQNNDGDTPSHLAAIAGNLRALKLLFKCGADGDIKNKKGFTPLEYVSELKKEGNSSQDIEEVIKFLEKDKQGTTTLKDYYDTIPQEEKKEENDDDFAEYNDSKIDNDDDLEDTPDNVTWKENKAKIKALYSVKGITQNLVNYGNNLILFYEKKISAVKELIERKSSDSKKNFVGDVTIQDEQKKNIGEMLWNDPSTKKLTDDEKLALISGYYGEIGTQAEEIMEKDYNDRNRTIKYLLLIREYETNIESIQNSINIKGAIQLESSTEADATDFFDTSALIWQGGSKKIMRGGTNRKLLELYTLLVEEYKNAVNSPINDPELQTYMIQYLDKLQFLIADPANIDTVQFKEVCEQLLDRINFLEQNQHGGQTGGVDTDSDEEDENPGFFRRVGKKASKLASKAVTGALGLDPDRYFGDTESGNEEYKDDEKQKDNEKEATSRIGEVPNGPGGTQPMNQKDNEKEATSRIGEVPNGPGTTYGDYLKHLEEEAGEIKLTPDSPEAIKKFIDSNDLLELDNMLKSGEITNVDIKDSSGDNAFGKATTNENLNKIWYLLSKGADINQKNKNGNTLLQEAVKESQDASGLINSLIRFGASKDGIDSSQIPNAANKKAFEDTNQTEEDSKVIKNALEKHIDSMIKEKEDEKKAAQPLPSSTLDQSDPKHPLYGQWKALQDAKKKRDDDFTKWSDEMKKLLESSTKVADDITKIKNGTLSGPQKYEDQKAAIEKVTKAQLDLIEAQTKACIDAYTKQTDDLNSDLLKQKELASQILTDITSEEKKDKLLDDDNIALEKESSSFGDTQNANIDSVDDTVKTVLDADMDLSDKNLKPETSHEMFVRKYITPNYVKKNLYEFMNQCRLLDSVPSWRAKISTLMVGYLTSYVVDPNDKSKHISVIPSYDYFNLVLQGTPGVGKSYSSAIIGKALKWCGFLTVGKMKEIKKPDIVGSYTGQTAPKVYNELTQGLGNIVFIDEAYSIAGAKDETKGTFNEFGQEALDAITDYTSEHIGLLAFIVAGYEYEMQNQFLNVNIGLPRRFPTVLTLRRYDMKSFWKILEMPIIKFCPKYQVDHQHHACFELLNIMFNYQWTPNPVLQISKKWSEWWEGYNLKNLIMNLKVNMISNGEEIINVPFVKLSNFDEKIKNIETTNITATSLDVLPLTELIGGDINMETSTFLKAYFIYKFCNIRNGDFFRSQADNLTKFGQTILSDKIINPSNLFDPNQDNNKNGNTKWIEYIYFDLYFTKNPNKPVENIKFSFETPSGEPVDEKQPIDETPKELDDIGGSKMKQYTKKNIKAKKYTRRNSGNKNKKTIHKYKNKRNKKTIRQRGGDVKDFLNKLLNYHINRSIEKATMNFSSTQIIKYIRDNPNDTIELNDINKQIQDQLKNLRGPFYSDLNPEDKKFYKGRLETILNVIKNVLNTPVDSTNTPSEPAKTDTTTPPQVDTTVTPGGLSEDDIKELEKTIWQIINYYKVKTIGYDDYDMALRFIRYLSKDANEDQIKNIESKINYRLNQLKADPNDLSNIPIEDRKKYITDLNTLLSYLVSQRTTPQTPTTPQTSTTPDIIQPTNLPPEIKGDFSTLLNYYIDPSIIESDFNPAYKNIEEKLPELPIDDLKYMYVLTALRLKQLQDPSLKPIPSKYLELIIEKLNGIKKLVNDTLTTKDKTFKPEKLSDEVNDLFKNPSLINNELAESIKAFPDFEKKLELKENLNVKENVPSQKEFMNMNAEEKKQAMRKQQLQQQQSDKFKTDMKNLVGEIKSKTEEGELSNLKNIDKDLVFDIVGINFSAFRDTQEITETIVRNKMIDNEINNKQAANEKLKTIFVTFMKKYNEYLTLFANDTEMDVKQKHDLPIFINTYLLLACYNTALIESKVPLAKFNNDSWWFFTAGDFKKIAKYLDIEIIIENFEKLIDEHAPEITPEKEGKSKEGDKEGDKEEDKEEESKEAESKEEEKAP